MWCTRLRFFFFKQKTAYEMRIRAWSSDVCSSDLMAPLRGWAPVGQRLHAKVPYGHWKTMTFIAALRCDRIDAPFVFDQPINGASFTRWVEQQLCPTLGPGDIVILDNLSSHKKPAVRAAIRARGARLLFLPPYSPDLNPIEQVFAKLNTIGRAHV